ncbi:MAG: TonB-dependent receptor [Bacteroidetes bacterium]|nr:TonB-dependent receptor [Bacteroidota bacterium]
MKYFSYKLISRLPFLLLIFISLSIECLAQGTGSVKGKTTDENGKPVPFVNILVVNTNLGAASDINGNYEIKNITAGTIRLRASAVGFKTVTDEVTITSGETAEKNFIMSTDLLNMKEVVVTGVVAPLSKMKSTVAISTLTPRDLDLENPRSTTEILRYVPGFTRLESSGGEVNENITMRGILGVEYVMFMEDGLPVFPTMHTFFMNADNLFRPDLNLQKVEVVRGGNSALFGSNTPGAIVNFIDKTGGSSMQGVIRATAESQTFMRYDFNVNGPIANDWRFNLGGFYRYDHGVRDPGFPGISGGQLKANITKLLDDGFVRISAKLIDDRNQFILDLPFDNPSDPQFVPGFGDYGSMNTIEGNNISVPTPDGRLNLPLDHGLLTQAYWITADIGFNFNGGWNVENSAQIMNNKQEWNAILPFDVNTLGDYISGLNLPAGSTYKLFYTNVFDGTGKRVQYNTPNNLISPGGEWHVEKPIAAFQDQLQIKKQVDQNNYSLGVYFANYSQTNHWYFTDILMDVEDNPHFLDLEVYNGADTIYYTKNGFRNYMSNYVNGTGMATIFSAVGSASLQLTNQLRADLGVRYEWDNFNQSSENTSFYKLTANPNNRYDNELWGNNTYTHFNASLDDWAASIGLNYSLSDDWAIYAQSSRAYKMPALDEYLNTPPGKANLFQDRQIFSYEAGVKYSTAMLSFTLDAYSMYLKNIVSQGAVVDPVTGRTIWIIQSSPDNHSYGLEAEVSATPAIGFNILASGTLLKAVYSSGASSDIGSLINGVPPFIGNLSATYTFSDFQLLGDIHYVGQRYVDYHVGTTLPAYTYFNFGLAYNIPTSGVTLNADILNAFQSKGLEEGNPRKILVGGQSSLFLARPILPRRFSLSATYSF